MCHERTCRGATGNRLQHRRFHFEETKRVHELADEAHDLATFDESLADLRIDDQVDVTLPVTGFGIGQAGPFLGQRAQVLAQQFDRLGPHGQLAGLGFHQAAAHADDVADVPGLEVRVDLLAQQIALHEGLYAARSVLNGGETGLAHDALGHQAAGDREAVRTRLQGLGRARAVGAMQVVRRGVAAIAVRIGPPFCAQLVQLLAALGDQKVFVLRLGVVGHVCVVLRKFSTSLTGPA